jgi:hypothetical protein
MKFDHDRKFSVSVPVLVFAAATSLSGFMYGCYSHDLGSEKPDRVPVTLGLSDWDSGAGAVIQQKCANCHTAVRASFVPANTPHEIDGMGDEAYFHYRKNRYFIKEMLERVEGGEDDIRKNRLRHVDDGAEHEAEGMMPPKFATPLYPEEKLVLIGFLKARIQALGASDQPNAPDPTDPTDPQNPPASLKFADVESIAIANCAKSGCHDGARRLFPLKTREDFLQKKPLPLESIQSGDMPLDNPSFKDSADGQKLIQYLLGPQSE